MIIFLTFLSILSLILVFSAGISIGKYLQSKKNNNDFSYDEGWNDCLNHIQRNYRMISIDEMLNDLSKELND